MALEPTDQGEEWIAADIGFIADMSPAQERVIRAYADAEGFADLRKFRGVLADREWTYYDVLRIVYGE